MSLPMLFQTCRHSLLDKIKVNMGAVKTHTWKKLVEQVEIAEKSAKKFESPAPKTGGKPTTKDVTQLNPPKPKREKH